jgi:hypothetical protein
LPLESLRQQENNQGTKYYQTTNNGGVGNSTRPTCPPVGQNDPYSAEERIEAPFALSIYRP